MPKILENVRENLLKEARKQVTEQGYSAMTIRSVAGACGLGIGTVYNYFPSKDVLVASFMLEDWQKCRERMQAGCEGNRPSEALESVYEALKEFMSQYSALFQDKNAGIAFAKSFGEKHKILRSQIAKPLYAICEKQDKADSLYLSEFVAEAMLTWTMEGYDFSKISSILLQLF